MFSGIKEIIMVGCVLAGLFIIPRLLRRGDQDSKKIASNASSQKTSAQRGRMRLVILLSVAWIIGAALLLNPLKESVVPFLLIGVFPVLLGWGIRWVVQGFSKD